MKCQVAWNWKKSRTELVVTSQRRERIVLPEAEWLKNPPTGHLLPVQFEYSNVQGKRQAIRYDVMGKTKLSKLLRKKTLSDEEFRRLFYGLCEAVDACVAKSFLIDKILFNPGFVYLDSQGKPRFVFIPFANLQFDAQLNSPFSMLEPMSNPKRIRMQSSEGERRRDALHRYVLQEKVFSVNSLKKLAERELFSSAEVDARDSRQSVDTSKKDEHSPVFLNDLFSSTSTSNQKIAEYIILRPKTGERILIPAGEEVLVGRSETCDVVIRNNAFLCRQHLRLRVLDGYATMVDCGSTNGTFVYNKRLVPNVPVSLRVGDSFHVGGEEFRILAHDA